MLTLSLKFAFSQILFCSVVYLDFLCMVLQQTLSWATAYLYVLLQAIHGTLISDVVHAGQEPKFLPSL